MARGDFQINRRAWVLSARLLGKAARKGVALFRRLSFPLLLESLLFDVGRHGTSALEQNDSQAKK
jgi:hypothetical protein